MQLICTACSNVVFAESEDDGTRCDRCGNDGTMRCAHIDVDATGEACADCGADFS